MLKTQTWKTSFWTAPFCAPIRVLLERPKNGGQETQALGRSRGGFSTKIHVNVDGLGNPLRFVLTGGERYDSTQAEALIAGFDFERLLADKSYDVETFIQQLVALGVEVAIPPRANRKDQREYDKH